MIRYALNCHRRHAFEAWFRSSEDYDEQIEAGAVQCPHCGNREITKAIMSPGVRSASERAPAFAPGSDAPSKTLIEAMRALRDQVRETAEYVGDGFAAEARRIHYEETEPRGIYGEATAGEAKELNEEGIDVHPLPVLPEDHN